MQDIYQEFHQYFEEEKKEKAVRFILSKLDSKEINVVDLYTKILTPSLNQMVCKPGDEPIAIYQEHVKTAIVRTIIECAYPYVLNDRDELGMKKQGVAIILCPPGEYHDLGARMVADYFILAGFEAVFVGSNTPYPDVYHALHRIKPEVVAISVSNYYNLVTTKKMITELHQLPNFSARVVVGGYAFHNDSEKYRTIGADYYARTFEDILNLGEKEVIA